MFAAQKKLPRLIRRTSPKSHILVNPQLIPYYKFKYYFIVVLVS